MMNRRDFCKHLALLTAGAAALPAQIAAFEQGFLLNSPPTVNNGLIAVNELFLGGMATTSNPALVQIFAHDRLQLSFAMNLLGGVIRWVATPQQPMQITTADQFKWTVKTFNAGSSPDGLIEGSIRYIDQGGVWQCARINRRSGSLADISASAMKLPA